MKKINYLIIIPLIIFGISIYGFFSWMSSLGSISLLNINSNPREDVILSGFYTGDVNIGGSAYVPDANIVTLRNAVVIGGEIYVYGKISVTNSIFFNDIYVETIGEAEFINVTLKNDAKIYCYGNSNVFIENIHREFNYSSMNPTPEVMTFDYSNTVITNSVITVFSCGKSNLTLEDIQGSPGYPTSLQKCRVRLFQEAQANIKNSEIDFLYLGDQYVDTHKPLVILNSSKIDTLWGYGNSTTWVLNSTTILTILGYNNAIFYVDSSSSYFSVILNDNSAIFLI